MKLLRIHGPFLLLMMAISFLAFGWFMKTPLWDHADAQVLQDAHNLNQASPAMFTHIGFYFSQPLLQMAFMLEYRVFGIDPAGYIAVNLILHGFNAFLVYMLVHMLFPNIRLAILAGILFALGVGSYGKILMNLYSQESLLLASLHLLVLYFFIRNDFRRDGRILSPLFVLGLFLFLITGLTKTASFSLILTLMAYKAFFYRWRQGRAILSADLLVLAGVGVLFHLGQAQWGYRAPTIFQNTDVYTTFSWISFKNIFRYLNMMFFPMQYSPILESAPRLVTLAFELRTLIRVFLTLSIISYSFFGFIFGSKAIRFFLAWTYITLLPFTGIDYNGQWLNLSHLYLTSLGFCVILAAGTTGTSGLLIKAGRKRFLPLLVPLFFATASVGLAHVLDAVNTRKAEQPRQVQMREDLQRQCREGAT